MLDVAAGQMSGAIIVACVIGWTISCAASTLQK